MAVSPNARPLPIDEEFLCCPLCCRTLHVPKVLPCLHVFCRKCLRTHVDKSKVQYSEKSKELQGSPGGVTDHRDSGYSGSGDSNLKLSASAVKKKDKGSKDDLTDTVSETYLSPTDGDVELHASDHDDSYYEIPMTYGDGSQLDPHKVAESQAKREQAEAKAKLEKADTIYENDSDDTYVMAGAIKPGVSVNAKAVTIPNAKPRKTKEHKPSVSSLDIIIPAEDLSRKPSMMQYMAPDKPAPIPQAEPQAEYVNLRQDEIKRPQGPTSHYINADQVKNSRATYKHWTIRQNSANYEDIDDSDKVDAGVSEVFYDVPKTTGGQPQHIVLDGYLPLDSQNISTLPRTQAPPPPDQKVKGQEQDPGQSSTNKGPPLMKVRQKSPAACNGEVKEEKPKSAKHSKKKKSKAKEPSGRRSPAPPPYQAPGLEQGVPLYEEAAEVLYPGQPPSMYFPCPVCDQMFQVPEAGVEEFKTCTLVKSMQDRFQVQKKVKNNCDNCESKVARFKCFECKKYLCSGCRDAHGWRKATRKHKVMALSDTQSPGAAAAASSKLTSSGTAAHCHLHRRRPATHLCATCDHILCADCVSADHKGHVCALIEHCVHRDKDFLGALTEGLGSMQSNMDHAQEQLKTYTKSCLAEKKVILENLEKQKREILEKVNQAYDELCKQVEEEYSIERHKVDDLKRDIINAHKQLNQGLAFSNNMLRYSEDGDIVAMSGTVINSLNKMKEAGTPELQSKLNIKFNPQALTTSDVKSLFGTVQAKQQPVRPSSRPQRLLSTEQSHSPILSYTFKAKIITDTRGCKPTGVTMMPNDSLMVVDDINKKVKQFDQQGHLLWECCPEEPHQLIDPWDIICTRDQHLAITDRGSKSVKVFTRYGDFVREFGSPLLQSAWGIAENSKGDIIVTDAYQKSVFIYDSVGERLFSLPNRTHGDPNLFKCPEYVAINQNDDIIISDFDKHCIFVFDCLGRHLFTFGSKGNNVEHFSVPCGVCIDKDGNILVADYNNQRIAKISRNGQFLGHIATRKDSLVLPQALAYTNNDHLVVLDRAEVKVFRFTAEEPPLFRQPSPTVADMSPLDFRSSQDIVYDTPLATAAVADLPKLPPPPPPPVQSSNVETTV